METFDYAIFVQARLGSTRFPRKVLQSLSGKRVLDHVLNSCDGTGVKTILLVPTTDEQEFRKLFVGEIFAGSEQDVLARFHECALKYNVKNIVRITSDCPLLPSSHISEMIQIHKEVGGFVSNVAYDPGTYSSLTGIPDGFDVEIFDRETLELAHKTAASQSDREHVTPWMRKNCKVHIPQLCLSLNGKFSLDTHDDIVRLENSFDILSNVKTRRIA